MTNEAEDRPGGDNAGAGPDKQARQRGTPPGNEEKRYYADDYASRRWGGGKPGWEKPRRSDERYAEAAEREGFKDFPGWRGPKHGNPYGPGGRRFDYRPGERRPAGQAPGHVSRSDWNREGDFLPSRSHRGEGPHRGKGPKGYRRSDVRIHEDVCDRLLEDGFIDASRITVVVNGGEVTLNGHVEDKTSKRAAEDCADAVRGVRHVQNNLRIDVGRFP